MIDVIQALASLYGWFVLYFFLFGDKHGWHTPGLMALVITTGALASSISNEGWLFVRYGMWFVAGVYVAVWEPTVTFRWLWTRRR